jgi:hypothetical protein
MRWKDNSKIVLTEISFEDGTLMEVRQDRCPVAGFGFGDAEPYVSSSVFCLRTHGPP